MHSYFFWAWSCVDLFFILSGFLITGIILNNAHSPRMLFAFYMRRTLRIWPVYYFSFLATILIYLIAGWLKEGSLIALPSGQWLNFFFLQYTDRYFTSIDDLDYLWYFAHSWSLAVEEQFYLFWPALFFLFKPGFRGIVPLVLLGLGFTILARHNGAYFYLLATRIDGLLLGILLAFLVWGRSAWLYRIPAICFFLAGLLSLCIVAPYLMSHGKITLWGQASQRVFEVTGFCLFYAVIVASAVRWTGAPIFALLRTRPLLYFGRISFALYMFQVPIFYLLTEAAIQGLISKPVGHVLTWTLTLLAAHLSHIYLERRFLALKRFFPYPPKSATYKPQHEAG